MRWMYLSVDFFRPNVMNVLLTLKAKLEIYAAQKLSNEYAVMKSCGTVFTVFSELDLAGPRDESSVFPHTTQAFRHKSFRFISMDAFTMPNPSNWTF